MSDKDGVTATGVAVQPSRPGSPELTRLIGWLAAAAIAASILVMIVISAAGPSVSVPAMRRASGLPWWHALHRRPRS